jgi:hypothetical protein
MGAIKRLVAFVFNVVVLVGVLALLAAAGWGTWQIMPEASRNAIRNPGGALGAAERGVSSGPTNPLVAFGNWLQELVGDIAASRRDLVDTVRTADGSDGGIVPLPAWATLDEARVFGSTETFWQSRRAKLSGARWSRVVFFWSEIQPGGPRDWRAGHYLRDKIIEAERRNGIELVGLLMNTPPWAASRRADGVRSVPAGLNLPVDHPQNAWAAFVRKMAADYRGRIDTWIIWNEPDIRLGGPNEQYYSWAGSDEDYAQLLRVAHAAAKLGNPNARIVFASTTYWSDANAHQPLFLERVLSILARDPESRAKNFYFDAVGLNLYTSPDDLLRVAGVYREVLDRYGLSTPLWLTETNAVPYDDPGHGLRREQNGLRVTMDEQASFVVQAYAMGLAAGYQRIAFHSMMDRDTNDELWGLLRNDGTMRPAFVAYQTAARYLGGARRAVFAGRERDTWRWPRNGYVPNWYLYLVAIERPPAPGLTPTVEPTPTPAPPPGGVQRVSVVWNGDAEPRRVAIPRTSERATLVDKYGRLVPIEADGDRWLLTLPGATAHSSLDPDGYYFIGGDPLLLIEDGAPEGAPVLPPEPIA